MKKGRTSAALLVELLGIETDAKMDLTCGNTHFDDAKVRETTRNDLRIPERCWWHQQTGGGNQTVFRQLSDGLSEHHPLPGETTAGSSRSVPTGAHSIRLPTRRAVS